MYHSLIDCRKQAVLQLLRALAAHPPEGICDVIVTQVESNGGSLDKKTLVHDVTSPSADVTTSTDVTTCSDTGEEGGRGDDEDLTVTSEEIKRTMQRHRQTLNMDFDWLHEIGSGCDDTELPHHVSSEHEIEDLICAVEDVLGTLPQPKLVTIARCVIRISTS